MRKPISLFGLAIAGVLTGTAADAVEPAAADAVEPAAAVVAQPAAAVISEPAAAPAAPAAPVPATAVPATAEAPKVDRMQQTVCRKDKVIGSLVLTKKTCHTRAQWASIDYTNQALSRELVDSTRTRPSGN